jgi:hypothetical protein
MANEEWRPVVGACSAHFISSHGRVRGPKGIMKAPVGLPGYKRVGIRYIDGYRHKRVHVLVAEAFIGPRPSKHEVAHADGNPLNNSVENLRYATRRQNLADARRHGTLRTGHRQPGAKLTPEKIQWARENMVLGSPTMGNGAIAKMFGVSPMTLSQAVRGLYWKADCPLTEYDKAMEEVE